VKIECREQIACKALLESSSWKLQKQEAKLNFQFSKQSVAIDNTESSTEERHSRIDEAGEGEASTSNLRLSDEADDPWIKAANSELCYSSTVKRKSMNKGWYFQKKWVQHHNWLWYHQEKIAAFCGVCTMFRQPHDSSLFIFSDTADGFKN
jgi:hypothetical protein